jgi:nitroreductase
LDDDKNAGFANSAYKEAKNTLFLIYSRQEQNMNFDNLIRKNRSYRRFYQEETIPLSTLSELANYVRLSPSSGNIQGIKMFLSAEPVLNRFIFEHLRWAFYLKDWEGPPEGERPAAYIVMLWDTDIREPVETDTGIAAQSILLGAVSKGLGGCIIGSVDRVGLRKALGVPEHFQIPLVIALGKPLEQVVIEDLPASQKVEYWRDDFGIHHVPKRRLEDIAFTHF